MKFGTKWCSAALAGLLLVGSLAGCTTTETTTEPEIEVEEVSPSTTVDLPDGVPTDVVQEILGISRDTVVATTGDFDITAEQVLYWVSSSADTEMMYYYSIDWAEEYEGMTLAEYFLEEGLDTAAFYNMLAYQAGELGCGISEEDAALYASELEALKLQLGSDPDNAEAAYQKWLAYVGISDETFTQFNQTAFLYDSMQTFLFDPETVTDEDMAAFLEEFGVVRTPHILIAAQAVTDEEGNITDDGMATALAEITAIREEIRAAGDTEEAFNAAMEAYSQDGRDANGDLYNTEGYTYDSSGWLVDGSSSLVTEFVTAGSALAVGEISEPVQSAYGYHLLMRLDGDTEETRSSYATYQMSQLSTTWLEELVVEKTDAFDLLDPELYYTGLSDLRVQIQAQEEAETTEAE